MRPVYIIGVGQTPVMKRQSLRATDMAVQAIDQALARAHLPKSEVTMLVAGNMLSGTLDRQRQLATLIAEQADMRGIEATLVETSCSSGAAAVRHGFMAVAGGFHDLVMVCGVERMTHADHADITTALATASDWEREGGQGETFITLNARLMRHYMDAYRVDHADFAHFSVNAHRNALHNPHALLQKPITHEDYMQSRLLTDPIKLLDAPPICDGAAALLLATEERAHEAQQMGLPVVRVNASTIGTDSLSLDQRRDVLSFDGAKRSAQLAYQQAGMTPADVDLFELHDAYTVIVALSLEAAGFAEAGRGVHFGKDGEITPSGSLPIATMGGLKARGHPVGATGVYQIVESFLQLTEQAGENQVPNAQVAMTQSLGGTGATVVTHLLSRVG